MIGVTLDGTDARVRDYLSDGGARVSAAAAAGINDATSRLTDLVRQNLGGAVLQTRTGALLGSVAAEPAAEAHGIVAGAVRAGSAEAFYARFHEFGGSRAYEIVPVRAKMLHFFWEGREVFAHRVHRRPLPRRPFMERAAEEGAGAAMESVRAAIEADVLGASA